jgi:F-type H+-transporting ATPase subunit b
MAPFLLLSPARAEGPAPHGAPAPHGTPAPHGAPHDAAATGHGAADTHGASEGTADHGAGHHGPDWTVLGMQAANVLIFVAILVAVARRPIMDGLKNRSLAVRNQLEEARRLKAEADARAAEVEARLAQLDAQIKQMKTDAEADAAAEAERIRQRAEADAARLKETAERTIREEANRARNELRGEAAALAVQLARETIRRSVTPDDQERLAREFLAAVDGGNARGDACNGRRIRRPSLRPRAARPRP